MKDYHINIFYSDEDEGYIADIPDLVACSAFGNTPEAALREVKLAKEARVHKLYLSHFNPDHSDEQIDEFISLARKEFPQTYGATEGFKIDL